MEIKHAFESTKGDGPDSTRVRPSDWNENHVVTATAGPSFIGRTAAGPGPMTEIPLAQAVPLGVILPYGGTAAPAGWLLGFGQLVSRVTYADLFLVFGTTFGAGDGVTTFGMPDMRGVVPAGRSNMGGSDRGNLTGGTVLGALLGQQTRSASVTVTSVSGGISGSTFGALSVTASGQTAGPDSTIGRGDQGGSTLVASQSHTHSITVFGSTGGSLGVTGSFSGTGGGVTASFSIVQPTIVLNYIVNTGV
jgi:microcystin-dependent protein